MIPVYFFGRYFVLLFEQGLRPAPVPLPARTSRFYEFGPKKQENAKYIILFVQLESFKPNVQNRPTALPFAITPLKKMQLG